MSSAAEFYQQLRPLTQFSELAKDDYYQPLPDDWTVVITDVSGSTKAIEAGRYKDVNLVGAATIAAVRNVLDTLDFPFVFGGDGASFAVPSSQMEAVGDAMSALRSLSKSQFDLDLRIGAVEVQELVKSGKKVEVAKYNLIENRCITLFRGGGLTLAEKWIKEEDSNYLLPEREAAVVSMKGLSCRWNAVPNEQGEILSLLISSRSEKSYEVYTEVLKEMDKLLNGQLESANPVNTHTSTYQSIRQCIQQEHRLNPRPYSPKYWLLMAEIIFCVCVFRLKMPPLFFDPKRYIDSMRVHADYRKFDDMLRMVVDISSEQSTAIASFLEEKYQAGVLYYGLHRSDSSLMTCFVDDISDGKHIHFIDGNSGGYALAAKQMKAQMKANV